MNSDECSTEHRVVRDFQCAGDEKWQVDQSRTGKHEADKQRTDCRTDCPCHARYACRSTVTANGSVGISGTKMSRMFEGKCVATMVLISYLSPEQSAFNVRL